MDHNPPGSEEPWEFSRQEYWSGLLCPPPGDLPNAGIELLHWKVGSLPLAPLGAKVSRWRSAKPRIRKGSEERRLLFTFKEVQQVLLQVEEEEKAGWNCVEDERGN